MSVTMTNMGLMNAGWGVCGFTSSFYAMWELEPASHGRLINAPRPFSVLAEIKTYLRMLQAEGNRTAIREIEEFCQSFGPAFATWTVDGYCTLVSNAVNRAETDIVGDYRFGIGMPPRWVVDYLNRAWRRSASYARIPPASDSGGDAIIGMVVNQGTLDPGGNVVKTLYGRLVHYMYRRNGLIYTWGHPAYPTIEAAAAGGAAWAAGWQVGWEIKIGGTI